MSKDEALNEFLKGLRIVLNNASAYPKEHPYFIQSVDTFKKKLVALFPFLNPIRIDISAESLFMDGRHWEKSMLYTDLASLFHLRKIKSIEFKEGLDNQELIELLSIVSMPLKEVLRHGGIQAILNKDRVTHIEVEELDYSQLLRDEGEEVKDLWVYFFKASVQKGDLDKINAFAQNFEQIINKFSPRDLYEDEELRTNLSNFLSYLKGTDEAKFARCTKILMKMLLGKPSLPEQEKVERIRAFFQDLTSDDLIDGLLESISHGEDFNSLSFNLFVALFDQDRHKDLAPKLKNRIQNTPPSKITPMLKKRIKEIFSVPQDSYVFPLYRQALEGLWHQEEGVRSWSFDRDHLKLNYCLMLLNLLVQEKDSEALGQIYERLLKDCAGMVKEKNWGFLRTISEFLSGKSGQALPPADLERLRRHFYQSVENMIFEEEVPPELQYFLKDMGKTSLGIDFYLKKIFEEKKVNSFILTLLLKNFPDELAGFYQNLEKVRSDMEFLVKIVKSFQGVESPLGLEILKKIFVSSNNIIRLEVLKSMQSNPHMDKEFLLPLLKKEDARFKKQAFLILAKDDPARKEALDELFSHSSLLGFKNNILLENMMILEEAEGVELKEAKAYLTLLSKKPFFWNRNVREKALEVLKKLDAG